ncbi:MAG: hypothetical protein R3313_03200 [Candidatus Saccharimonadales bacterium]|nr:hypothetical protein [Candidatus Saccharimonadales bacterium]
MRFRRDGFKRSMLFVLMAAVTLASFPFSPGPVSAAVNGTYNTSIVSSPADLTTQGNNVVATVAGTDFYYCDAIDGTAPLLRPDMTRANTVILVNSENSCPTSDNAYIVAYVYLDDVSSGVFALVTQGGTWSNDQAIIFTNADEIDSSVEPPPPGDDPDDPTIPDHYLLTYPNQLALNINQTLIDGGAFGTYIYCGVLVGNHEFRAGSNPSVCDLPRDSVSQYVLIAEGDVSTADSLPATLFNLNETYAIEVLVDAEVIDERNPSEEEIDRSCFSGGLLAWVLCPLIKGLFEFIEFIYRNVILTSLVVDPLDPDSTDPATVAIYDIWNNFRIIANVLLFIIFILAIFGQGLAGFQVFSAYEFKKIVPRLVIGAIAVQLSFYMVGFAVDVFNVLGAGIRALMLAPVEGMQWGDFDFGSVGIIVELVTGGSAAWLARYAIGKIGFLYAMPLILIPIVIALLTTMVVLIFRKMLIFLLIVVSPVAFVLGIMPGFERWLKQWWDLLWKALFMFPLIIGFIAGGELVAKVLVAGDESSAANQIMGIIALFSPYFLIPATFKLAGNAVGAIAGGINQAGGGLKNKMLGEAWDKGSMRGRFRTARRENMDERKAAFARRNAPGQIKTSLFNPKNLVKSGGRKAAMANLLGAKDPSTGKRSGGALRGGWNRGSMERKVPTKAGKNPLTGWGSKWTSGIGSRARFAGAVGGIAASIATRAGWIQSQDQLGDRLNHGAKEAAAITNNDDSYMAAAFGFNINPATGESIDLGFQRAVMKHAHDDSGLMAGFLMMGFLTSGTEEVTHRYREQLLHLRDTGHISHDQANQIWEGGTYLVKDILPNLQNMDLETGEWVAGKVPEATQKDMGRAGARLRNGYHAVHWLQQAEINQQIVAGVLPGDPSAIAQTMVNMDKDRWGAINDMQQTLRSNPTASTDYYVAQQEIKESLKGTPDEDRPIQMGEVFNHLRTQKQLGGETNPYYNSGLTDDHLTIQLVRNSADTGRFKDASQLPEAYNAMLDYLEGSTFYEPKAADHRFNPVDFK